MDEDLARVIHLALSGPVSGKRRGMSADERRPFRRSQRRSVAS